mmetsp:Transcript_25965/g.45935  ORF Transcript_25965/g.45935 Transcript_25965/m.45935 type:complete len:227 (-) Transcript_25965:67-747(-)
MSEDSTVAYGTSRSRHFTRIQVVQADITREKSDAIVNAANRNLVHGAGIAGAINSKGGPNIQKESKAWVRKHGEVPIGGVAVTGPGKLPAKYVIHAVGPIYTSKKSSEPLLKSAIWRSLEKADQLRLKSISIPALSSGIFGYPKEDCAQVFFEAVPEYIRENPQTNLELVRLSNFDLPTTSIFKQEFDTNFSLFDVNLLVDLSGELEVEFCMRRPQKVQKVIRKKK